MAAWLSPGRSSTPAERWVDGLGATSAIAWAWLAASSHAPPLPLVGYGGAMLVVWGSLVAAITRIGGDPGAVPLRRILVWALVFRAIGLLAAPILEDDFYRYLWDGRVFALTGTPYATAPMAHFDDPTVPLAFQRILDGINNPDIPTLYAPIVETLFLIGYWIAPGGLLPVKLALVIADLATLALLMRMAPRAGVLLYAWCPLLVQETAFSAHPDSLAIFFVIAAFAAGRRRRPTGVAIAAALAVATKPLAVLLLPFLARFVRPRHGLAFLGALGLVYAPFVLAGGPNESAGLLAFATGWEFNSTGFALLAAAFGDGPARALGPIVVGGVAVVLLARERSRPDVGEALPRGDVLFGCLFLVSPVVNPWYLLWLLPFVAVRPSPWGVAALAAVSLSYAHGLFLGGLPAYHHPVWVRPTELALVGIGLFFSHRRRSRAQAVGPDFEEQGATTTARGGATVSHRTAQTIVAAVVLSLALGAAPASQASGTYRGRPASPATSIDRDAYELGKKVFAGQFLRSETPGDTATQAVILEALQSKLPIAARTGVDLPSYAGRLDDEQLAALKYFLAKRYKVE